jgi:hypothetical protein
MASGSPAGQKGLNFDLLFNGSWGVSDDGQLQKLQASLAWPVCTFFEEFAIANISFLHFKILFFILSMYIVFTIYICVYIVYMSTYIVF